MVTVNSTMVPLGTPAPDFQLADTVSGRLVARSDAAGRPLLVMFICNHCPYVVHIRPRLAELTRQWLDQGLAVVGISSNDPATHPQDGPQAMAAEARAAGYAFPYLFDADQGVARAYRAACTPDFQLYDRDHRLAYRGRFCASRPRVENPPPVTGAELAAAVEAVLAGRPAPQPQIPSLGCNIKWTPGREPAWFAP